MNSESLLISCGYQGLAATSLPSGINRIKLLHLKDLKIQAMKGNREAHQPTSLPACFPEVQQHLPLTPSHLHYDCGLGILPLH